MNRIVLSLLIVFLYCSCGPGTEAYFEEPAPGHRAFGLEGVYVFTYQGDWDSLPSYDTLKFERIRKNDFLVTNYLTKDTIFEGEIVKRKGLYFMNWPDAEAKNWWHISAFKFSGDSVYNYWGMRGYTSMYQEIKEAKLFSDVKETETAFYIKNSASETYEAMESAVKRGQRAAYRELRSSDDKSADVLELAQKNDPEFLVYPNPVKTNLTIESKADGKYMAEILDMNGRKVLTAKYSENYLTWM